MRVSLTAKEVEICKLLREVTNYIAKERPELPPIVSRIAGGWVRDKLLGQECDDIDVAVNDMMGYEFANYVKTVGGQTHTISKIDSNPAKSKHLETATTKLFGQEVDFCNLRTEEYSEESRIPLKIGFGAPEEDAYRRDITINSLFYNVNLEAVEDFTEKGLHDLKHGIVRTPLEPLKTFKDDPLRVLRCIRFASRLDFKLDDELREKAKSDVIKDALINKISRERVGTELDKMLKGPSPFRSIRLIADLGLYPAVFTPPTNIVAGSLLDTVTMSNQVVRSFGVLDRLRSKEYADSQLRIEDLKERRMLHLAASVLPYFDIFAEEKKKPVPAAKLVLRDALKSTNSDIMNICTLFQGIPLVHEAANKNYHYGIDRADLGGIIRDLGTLWRSTVKLCFVRESESQHHISWDNPTTVNGGSGDDFRGKYEALLFKAKEYGIDDCYNLKHMMDGKSVAHLLGIKPGPVVGDLLNVQMRWQLKYPNGTRDKCETMLKQHWDNIKQ